MLLDKKQVIELIKNTLNINVDFSNISLVHFDTKRLVQSLDRTKYLYFGHISVNLPLELYQNPWQVVGGTGQNHGMYAALQKRISRCITSAKSNYMNWRIFNDEISYLLFDELWYLPDNFEHINNMGFRIGTVDCPANGVYDDGGGGHKAYRLDLAHDAGAMGSYPFAEPVINFTGYRIKIA